MRPIPRRVRSSFRAIRNSFRSAESSTTDQVNGTSCYGSTSGISETWSVPSVLRHLSGRIKRGFAVAPTASGGSLEKDAFALIPDIPRTTMTPPPEAGAPPTPKPLTASMNNHSDKHLDQKRRKLGFVELPKGFGADYFFYRFLPREHILRRWCVQIVSHNYFDRFIIAAIVANSVILGLSDFSVVDEDLNPASSGKKYEDGGLVEAYSFQNHIVEISESPFTIIFTAECILKIISMGLYGKGSYFKDTWNILDFLVVVSSLVASLPGMPNVSAIRTIRVLRPLRSLSVIPGMRRLIAALLKALPALGNVVILQIFVFFIFGILGIQLFGGSMNRRCRLTSQPVKLPLDDTNGVIWPVPSAYLDEVKLNESAYFCLDADLLDYEDATNYTKETSPWNTPQNCFWPVDEKDEFLCAAPTQPGNHNCNDGMYCGSDYDAFGNPRFSHKKAMDYALYRPSLDWGLTTFDNIGFAFFTIFQSITQEGWTIIMYMVMDSSQPTIGAIFFVVLIIFASFFVMNLTLAVISEEFNLDQKPGKTAAEKREEERKAKLEKEKAEKKAREHWLNAIVSHRLFSGFIMCVILANTGILAMDHYPMPTKMDEDLEIVNFALSCVFVVEMIMKLFGLGLRQYSRDKFNLFDAFIVTMGILEMIASPPSFMSSNPPKKGAVSALRSFRLFRVFKLARDWKSLRELLEMIIRAVASIANFGVLLFLFIYIYALVGVQFFGNTMRFDGEGYPTPFNLQEFWNGTVPRNNFDTLLWAAVTVFQIITGENWNNIMYYAILGNGMLSCVYFISLVILGDFVLMNLFLALLLDNFGDNDEEQEQEKQEETKKLAQKMSVMNMSMKVTPITTSESERTMTTRGSFLMVSTAFSLGGRRQSILEMDEEGDEEDVRVVNLERFADELTPSVPLAKTVYIEPPARLTAPVASISPRPLEKQGSLRRKSLRNMMTAARNSIIASSRASVLSTMVLGTEGQPPEEETEEPEEANGPPSPFSPRRSLFLFAADSKVRRAACYMSTHPWFDSIVFSLIVISSIALAVDNPLADPTSSLATFLKGLDKALAIVFAIEMVIKIVAMGLILHKGAYLRNSWNIIDGVIVISSIIMLVAESSGQGKNLKSLRSLRGLRTFRPLRMISRRPGLKLVVNALFEAIPEVINVLFVCMLFFLIFSIIAVNYLKGTFSACSGDVFSGFSDTQMEFLVTPKSWNISSELQRSLFNGTDCELTFPTTTGSELTSEYVCECWGADWGAVLPQNFNNVGSAMLTFFEISTTEGWADVMMAAIDNNGIGMQPIRDNNMVWALFFVLFIMVGSFFVVNLFVGVIIDNFNRMKAALGGDFMLTPEQKKWIEAQKAASRVGPVRILKPPRQYFRRQLFFLVKMQRFEWFIMICIIVNTFLMAAQYFGESTMQAYVINIVNEVFAVIFTLEAVMKLTAFGWEYFEDQWNQFDFFVVLGTLLSVVVELFTGASVRSLAMLVRVFRVTRILRLVKASKSIRQILLTLYIALPGLSNITSILFLMLFIYATMGVQIFAKVALSTNIDEHANFQDFGKGFLFLLRAATGEAWNSCMHDLASSSPGCVDDPPYDPGMCGFNDFEGCKPLNGCGNPIAYGFFCTFTLLVTYVMLNLTIAVILEGFSLSHEDEEPLFEPEILDEFQTKWADIDPKATGFVKVDKMLLLVNLLRPPLGKLGVPFDMAHFFKYMCMLEIPLYEGEYVYFRDVLLAMTREMVKLNAGTISDMPPDQDPGTTGVPGAKRRIEFSAHQYFGARRIQRQVAGWLRIKRKLEKEYMEEYKNKIKKPSGRPKKQRDARVFTVG